MEQVKFEEQTGMGDRRRDRRDVRADDKLDEFYKVLLDERGAPVCRRWT
jgi:hypothetical protein